jgi:anaerobic magnesium-protoporphyrin IX monomethyl ester cyclase
MKNKIILFSIPNYNTVYIPLALPCLAGHLRKSGFYVIQRDLNILAYNFFLNKEYLQKCLKNSDFKNNRIYQEVINSVEEAKKAMRDFKIYKNFGEFLKNKKILEDAFKIICGASKEPLRIYGNTFEYRPKEYYKRSKKISYKSREGLLKSIENKKENIFYDFFKKQIIPFLKTENPALIGISIFDQKQLVVAFILSSLIKEYQVDAKIVLGGNVITRVYDVLSKDDDLNRRLFNYIDFIIHHEGEIPILEIAKRLLSQSTRFDKIPKLIYKKDGKIVENLEFNITDLCEVPTPDFNGFDLNLYWVPQPVISYLIKRGCSHRCNFCDTPFSYDGYYDIIEKKTGKKFKIIEKNTAARSLPVDRVIKEIKYLNNEYKFKYFSFADEELSGSFLKIFCAEIIKENIDIRWECFARMEPRFKDINFCKLLAKAGCMFLQFGLESVSQKILTYENKATRVSEYPMILKNTCESGIMNHIFLLIGTPYDNLLEAIKILAFLEEYGQYIHTIRPIIYKTSKWSPNAFNAESKGLTVDKYGPDLDIYLEMWKKRPKYGMSIQQAKIVAKILELWVRYKHKVNPVIRTYIYAQRLFIGPELIKEYLKLKKAEPEKISKSAEEEILINFSEALEEELKKNAYISKWDFVRENIGKEYPDFESFDERGKTEAIKQSIYLYNSGNNRRLFFDKNYKLVKSRRRPLALDELINFSKRLRDIDSNIIY